MEYMALTGARRVLAARPRIICEVTEHHEAIGKLLKEADYEFYAARATDRQPLLRPSRDTIAVPRQSILLEGTIEAILK
jgi:hypothetical protein